MKKFILPIPPPPVVKELVNIIVKLVFDLWGRKKGKR
jgi:hypothetical protein